MCLYGNVVLRATSDVCFWTGAARLFDRRRENAVFGWSGMLAPTSFPNKTVRRIAAVVRAAFPADPKAQGEPDLAGSEVLGTDPDDLRALQESETVRWNAVIARLGLRFSE